MVSNDDISFDVQQRALAYPDFFKDVNNTGARTHTFTVPSNKQWIIKAVTLERDDSYLTEMSLIEPEGFYVGFMYYKDTDTYFLFQPSQELILNPGWKIEVKYYHTIDFDCESYILYEERNKY